MKQILQNLGSGETQLADVPSPQVGPGRVLIRTGHSLISAGTERMLLEFGKANLLDKARSQPEKVRQVLDKIKTDGPESLCARVPDGVSDEAAAFTVVGAIALQGIRLAGPTLGESFAVVGLGLVGLMTVQLLRGSGCRVLGIDTDPARIKLARTLGADVVDISDGGDPVAHAMSFSGGRGVDGVLFTASTKSSEPMHQAAEMCRKRGRIVLVGVAGLQLRRSDFYEKELSFQFHTRKGIYRLLEAAEGLGGNLVVDVCGTLGSDIPEEHIARCPRSTYKGPVPSESVGSVFRSFHALVRPQPPRWRGGSRCCH